MVRVILALLLVSASLPLSAQTWQDTAALKKIALAFARQQTQALPGEVTVSAGAVEDNLRLPPCPAPAAWLPAGSRLWGSTSVGVRCIEPAWNVFIPVSV
jgi:flagella basal body P-ring formation protein FlgA